MRRFESSHREFSGAAKLGLILLCACVGVLAAARPAAAQLDEDCTVSVLNRTAQVRPDGVWILSNVPANVGQVRARATCVKDGVTLSGQSDFFTIPPNGSITIPKIVLGASEPIPSSLTLSTSNTTLASEGATTQLTVTAEFTDGSTADLTASSAGTSYTVSNAAVATVSPDGLLTAATSGTVVVSATNEGALGLIQIQVVLTGDSDNDGIPDDVELANGLNPNNPVDALEDFDRDGLTNKEELVDFGTDIQVADSDGDGIDDGEEVKPGADGFITNPLLVDTDGDGIRDGLEIFTGSDPTDPASFNLAQALDSLEVTPTSFILIFNTIAGDASRQLSVTGELIDGTTIDLTSTTKGTNYTSSDLTICNFGFPDGRVFAGSDGACTITATNDGFSAQSSGVVSTFTPMPLSFVDIPGYANNVDVSGNFAYVAAGATGLQVISVGNRQAPEIIGSIVTPGNANDIKVVGNLAYIADGSSGLQVIDVTDPTQPTIVGSVDTPGDAWDVAVRGNLAYIADGALGLAIVDVTNLANPQLISTLALPGTQKGVDVDPVQQIAVVASGSSGLHIVDVSDPTNPNAVGNVTAGLGDARDVSLVGNFAFVADFSTSFTSVDITDPTNPVVRASTPLATGGRLQDLTVAGRFGLGADVLFVNGVPIIDVGDPANPNPRAILDFRNFRDDNGTGIAADGSFVYLTAGIGIAENGTAGNTRLYIGQYLSQEDTGGIPPTVVITAPAPGSTFIEGSQLSVSVDAVDDVTVVAVDFLVDNQVVFTDTSFPYEMSTQIPLNVANLTLGATAVDLGGNLAVADDVVINVIPDPLTTVTGRVLDEQDAPLPGATATTLLRSATTATDGTFSITDVPTVQGNIVVKATIDVDATTLTGQSASFAPIPDGITAVGDIVVTDAQPVDLVPESPQSVGNCIPFGTNTSFGFSGFVYRNVPAFQINVGGRFAFDLGGLNGTDIRRNIYFAEANMNPVAGGQAQGIRALAWTQVVSDTQIPDNPRGDTIVGNYELTYTAEAPFVFPGGGFIVGFGGSPPGAYSDTGCEQVLVRTRFNDSSGFFHRRFFREPDQDLGVLTGGNSNLGGIKINVEP